MENETNPREVLFRVGDREIIRNGLYAIIGPANTSSRHLAVSYDPQTDKTTWVSPEGDKFYRDGRGLMAVVYMREDFRDAFNTSRPYLYFPGGSIEFDHEFRPTPEQIRLLQNWHNELHKAGIGGVAPDITLEEIRDEFKSEFLG